MSALVKTLHPDEKVKAGKLGTNLAKAGAGIFVIFGIVSAVLGQMQGDHWKRFFYSFVVGWSYIFSICVGVFWLVLLHHLVRGRWATAVRRIAEGMSQAFPWVFAIGFVGICVPLLLGYKDLYYWAHPHVNAHLSSNSEAINHASHTFNHHLQHKLGWFSPGFFTVRYVIYAIGFTALSHYFAKKSRMQDETGDPKLSEQMRVMSGPGMIAYALLTCMAAFDILMSMAPKWYSTIYGVNFWGSACIGGFAALGLVVLGVQRSGRLVHSVNAEHYHDIGKWMFSFTFFWAYTGFSQFMLQWYGNMPEETVWYKYRLFGEWQWVSIAMLVGFWAFPFVFLMSRWTKRIVPSLVFFAVWQLVFHWLDLYWNVMPSYDWYQVSLGDETFNAGPLMGNTALHHVGFSPVDITVWIALVGFLLVGIGRNLKGNLIPVKDPTLPLSLGHENL
jgi:hypothetical protein